MAVGSAGSPTPPGRYAVTDKIDGRRYGSYYGCCILALTGHQTNPPPGWTGGDRLAIHGTDAPSTIGTPASAGCLRAADADLQVLMRLVPLGTPVYVKLLSDSGVSALPTVGTGSASHPQEERNVIGILIAVLVAALVYLILAALTGSAIVAIVGAMLVLLAGIPSGGFGFGSRFGGRGAV